MSFEDDMIEYGFWDGNDYLDYLMDEADRIQEELQEQEAQWKMLENYKYSHLEIEESTHYEIADVDELFFEGYDKEEELEKHLRQINRNKKNWIVKLWINDNPHKAKLWKIYFKNISSFQRELFTHGFTEKSWLDEYEEWKKWLDEYEEFEEFKTKSLKEWENLKNLTLAKYLICALTGESFDEAFSKSNIDVYKKYKVFKLWLKDNEDLWNNYIIHKYIPSINLDRISYLTAWRDTFKYYDSFAVWKFQNPSLWRIKSKEWFHNKKLMFEWIRNNSETWDKWNEDNSNIRKEIYNKYKLYFSNNEAFYNKVYNTTIEEWLMSYYTFSNRWENSEEELDENFKDCKSILYTDLYLLRLWIKEHVKEWKVWKYSYLWKNECNTNWEWENKLNSNDYFETWCKLYHKKYENWLHIGYKQWLKCQKDLEIWFLWLFDGNSHIFYEWAKANITDWNKIMNNVMSLDLHSAYSKTYGNDSNFNHWIQCNSNIWENQQNDVFNTLLRDKWIFSNEFEKTYESTYKIDLKIKELKYLSQIGLNIFKEGFAIIEMENKYGFFNEEGEIIIPIIYDKVLDYRNGFAPICIVKDVICKEFSCEYAIKKEFWGVVDKKGKVIAQPIYDKILQITEEYIVFIKDFVCGVVELSTSNEILYPQYDSIKILDNGMWSACIKENNECKWAVISQLGNVTPFKYSYIFNSDNHLTMVVENAVMSYNNGYIYGEWGYIDKNGNEIEPLVELDSPLSFEKYWKEKRQ